MENCDEARKKKSNKWKFTFKHFITTRDRCFVFVREDDNGHDGAGRSGKSGHDGNIRDGDNGHDDDTRKLRWREHEKQQK